VASPDLSGYVDLTLDDRTAQDVFAGAITNALSRTPDWTPIEGDIGVTVMEAMALEVSELITAVNRVPGAVAEVVFDQYGIVRFLGTQPTVTVEFTASDALGHDLLAGIRVVLQITGDDPVVFTTSAPFSIAPGATTGTVLATGDRLTTDANGTPDGTTLQIADSVSFLESAATSGVVSGGADPEADVDWLGRVVARLSRLSEVLAVPASFQSAALENPLVLRATSMDNTSTLPPVRNFAGVISSTGGSIPAGTTMTYYISAVNAAGHTLTKMLQLVIPAGTNTNSVALSWTADAQVTGNTRTFYAIYAFRSAAVVSGTTGYANAAIVATATTATDIGTTIAGTGTAVTGATLSTFDAAMGTEGASQGYVTVAVYGNEQPLADADLIALQSSLSLQAQANLGVGVRNAHLVTQAITVTVHRLTAYTALAVQAAVAASITAWLDPLAWTFGRSIRPNDLVGVCQNSFIDGSATGVDYVTTVTTPAGPVSMNDWYLTTPGVITVTVDN